MRLLIGLLFVATFATMLSACAVYTPSGAVVVDPHGGGEAAADSARRDKPRREIASSRPSLRYGECVCFLVGYPVAGTAAYSESQVYVPRSAIPSADIAGVFTVPK